MVTSLQPISLADSPQGSYTRDFANSWQQRLSSAQAAGIDVTKLIPVIHADWQRIRNGGQPWSNMEAALASHAALSHKPIITQQNRGSGGGLLGGIMHAIGNIPGDIGSIAEGLNPLTLLPALYHQGEAAINNPDKLVRPFEKLATGDVVGALKSASKTPLIDLIPGVYTAKNVLTGNWSEIEKHPVMTGLDVLPYASEAGKLAMAGRAVEGSEEAARLASAGKLRGTVEAQSPAAALLEGKPLKAAFRAAGGVADSPLSQRWFRATEAAKAATANGETPILPTIYRTSDTAAKIAEALGVDKETRELNRFHNIMRRVQGGEGKGVLAENQSWFADLSDKDKATVLQVSQKYQPGNLPANVTSEMADTINHFRTHADELAKPFTYDPWAEAKARQEAAMSNREYDPVTAAERDSTVARENKKFVAIPNDGHTIDVYPIGGDTGKAYLKVFDKQRKVGPLERALNQTQATLDDLTGRGEDIPEALYRAHERATVRFTDAQKELEAATTKFAKLHNMAAPARYGELLKDEFTGRLQSRVKQLSDSNVQQMYRYSDEAIARDLQNPEGARVTAANHADYNAATGENVPLRPQAPLRVNAAAGEGLGSATLRHFGLEAESRVIGEKAAAGDVKGALDYAESHIDGLKFTNTERAQLERADQPFTAGISSEQMQDIVAAKYARDVGQHDVIFKDVNKGDAANPTYMPHEATVLKKSALLTEQKESVLTPEQAATAAANITNHNFGPLVDAGIVTKGELHGIMDDVMSGWQELARQGYDPVYVPFTPEHKVSYLLDQKPLAGNLYTPRQFLSKDTLSFAPQAQDMAIAMTSYAVELMKQQGSLEMFKQVRSLGVTERSLAERYGVDKARRVLATEYVPYSETAGRYLSKPEMSLLPDADKLYIPRVLNKNLDRMMNTFERDGLFGAYDKAMKAYKFSVLTGPRHVAHVLFGGLAFQMGEHGVTAFPKFIEALRMVRSGEIPTGLSRGLDYFTPEELATMGQGKTMGRLMAKAAGSPFVAMKKFEELTADTQRVMTYLREVDKQAAHGVVDEAAHNAAMQLTNKVYMDIDGMAPVERTVLRHVFPFYAFTKHIIRYALNYPADHPWRAATIANITRIEQQDHESGLPSMFNQFLFLGGTDSNGNQTAIDVKNFNPFRSLDGQSPLTLAGFLSALSPAITAPAQIAGLNTLTATPDLYPTLDYDPRTGKLVASHPDAIPQLIQTLLPPTGALEGILGLSDNWRSLRKADPAAYNRALMSSMNLPFIPQTRNMAVERGKAQINLLHAAQGALSAAMRTGDTSGLHKYSVLPFQGQLVKTDRMVRLIETLRRLSPTGSPGAIIPRSHGRGSLGAALVR